MSKIFCIGLHKTGTVSIGTALKILGYNVLMGDKSDSKKMEQNLHDGIGAISGYESYDVFADIYCPKEQFAVFDRQYPQSKFILTTRNEKDWIKSCWSQIKKRPNSPYYHPWYYKHEIQWIWKKRAHEASAMHYFCNTDKLLVMDITKGDGWKEICAFLNVDIPDMPFPHKNKSNK